MGEIREEINFRYTIHDGESEPTRINLTYDEAEGFHIAKFHYACKRFARLMSFTEETVEEYFGEDQYDNLG